MKQPQVRQHPHRVLVREPKIAHFQPRELQHYKDHHHIKKHAETIQAMKRLNRIARN